MLKLTLTLFAAVLAGGPAFGQPNDLAEQLMDADAKQFAEVFVEFKEQGEQDLPILIREIDRKLPSDANDDSKEKLAKRQANAAVALLRLNQPEKVWPSLKHSPDPRARSYLIHRMGPLDVDATIIIKRLDDEPDITIRRALVLSLGEFSEQQLSQEDRTELLPKLQEMYRTDADPGLHGAVEWLLRQWSQEDWSTQANEQWAKDKGRRDTTLESIQQTVAKDKKKTPQWYVNGQGRTMVVIPGSVEFVMGSPKTEVGRIRSNETQHQRRIEQTFSIASKEVTVEQFLIFRNDHNYARKSSPASDCPVNDVKWYEAAAYCNWLSEQEGIPKDQRCYEPNKDGKYADGMAMAPNYLQQTGYRLPTEAEWEYVCRAGAETRYSFGESAELLSKYAWYSENSSKSSHPVGSLKPNDFGLFDLHGNSWEWCQDVYRLYGDEREEHPWVASNISRVLRGGSFAFHSLRERSAFRYFLEPTILNHGFGFRVARTLPSAALIALPIFPGVSEIKKLNN